MSLLRGPTTPQKLSILDNFGIFIYVCTCSICIHANKGVPVIATAGHVGQLVEPISHGSWLHIYAGSQTCIGSSALPHVHRMISMHAWTKNKTSSPCCIAFFNLIQQSTFPLQGVNARFEHTFCDEDSIGWLRRHLFQLLLVYISRNDMKRLVALVGFPVHGSEYSCTHFMLHCLWFLLIHEFMIAYLRNQAQYSAHILFANDLGPWKYLNYDCGAWNGESESFLNQHMRICVPAISCMHVCVGDGMVSVVSSCFTFFGVAYAQPFCRAKNLSSRSFKQRTREKMANHAPESCWKSWA